MRGQTVQGDGVPLRKAPLPSRVYPWSTKRHCGPLAFRRATEGSRVLRRVWGRQEGVREPYGALAPSCPRRRAAAFPCRRGYGVPPLRRETPAPPAAGRRHSPSAVGTAFPLSAGRPRHPPPPWVRRPLLRRETPAPPRRRAPAPPRSWDTASVASSGAPLYRRNGLPSAEGKKEKALPCGRTLGNKVTCSYS